MNLTAIDLKGSLIAISTVEAPLPWHTPAETIVFHHGLGASKGIWNSWTPTLVERYRLVSFDMRGHGASPLPANYEWSMDNAIDDLNAVLDAATNIADGAIGNPNGKQKVHLVGESIGGTIALAFAARHPERLASLTISNGTHKGGSIENLKPWQDLIASGGMAAWSAYMMQQRFHQGVLPDAMWRWYETQQSEASQDAILPAATMLVGVDLTDQLPNISIPTLLMHPDGSPFIPVPVVAELHALLPNARLEIFGNTRHGLPFSHAPRCSRTLRRFLASLTLDE